ncbi:MAG: gliding motility-associated lipoprotein [Pedobacter sp.]|nr:MAG: gliding motility-associated lipoprotein [Pedobacter sp.]
MRKIGILSLVALASIVVGWTSRTELKSTLSSFIAAPTIPNGMVEIPQGRALIGMTEDDMMYQGIPAKMISFSAFYMDETEVTNAQYREFVNWVRDSIAITMLGPSTAPNLFIAQPQGTIASGPAMIDWSKAKAKGAIWGAGNAFSTKLDAMYYSGLDALPGRKEIDVRKLRYAYSYVDYDLAVAYKNDPTKTRSDFIVNYTDNPRPGKPNEYPSVPVYPDTLAWKSDFEYSQNDPMVLTYFSHPSYNNYPVVGVTWEQANAYANWKTKTHANENKMKKVPANAQYTFRLPTEQEFEYAARGGVEKAKYPWGTDELYEENTRKGKNGEDCCLLANFKSNTGNYTEDNGMYTMPVKSFKPNGYGLYNMAGNVAEWTSTTYNRSSNSFLLDFNPNYNVVGKTRKVVKGGSWKDIAYNLQNASRTFEMQDKPTSYIGFRLVASIAGAGSK